MRDSRMDRVRRIDSGEGAEPLRMGEEIPQLEAPPADPIGVWGYPDTYSYFPGETMQLHVSASTAFFGLQVYDLAEWYADRKDVKFTIPPTAIDNKLYKPMNAGESGIDDWQWPANASVPIGNWPSGIYVAMLSAYDSTRGKPKGTQNAIGFVVKRPLDQPAAPILYKLNVNTIQAYNLGLQDGWQDGNHIPAYNNELYVQPKAHARTEYKITFRRPVWSWSFNNKSVQYDYPMIHWLRAQGYAADFCTDVDLHLDNSLALLGRYRLLLSMGHDEYWSTEMRRHVETFRGQGGNIAFLSGNTVCWRVHFKDVDNGVPTAYVCDKGDTPLCDVNSRDAWWKINPNENALVGVGTRNCAIRLDIPNGPFSETSPLSPGFRVQNAADPLFAGTGLTDGFVIGVGDVVNRDGQPIVENLIGYEGGGARITFEPDGSARCTFTDGTPANFVLLGVGETAPTEGACNRAPCGGEGQPCTKWWAFSRETRSDLPDLYAATMGYYRHDNSLVFTGSTIHWANILNEWDTDDGFWRNVPRDWRDGKPQKDPQGHPILGNKYLHFITRNVIDASIAPLQTVTVRPRRRRRAVET